MTGEFTIIRELGRGGMGRVYLAHQMALERRVAMKVLPPTLAEQGEIVERFQREARTAGKLNHPNIVPVYQVAEREGLNFFTMPYVAGPNLRQVLRQTPKLEADICRRYLREAAEALAYAHDQGVVHRDIKPENMIMEGSRDGRLMLTDFGIAKALGTATLTRPGDMMGTPYYMSPEQCEETEDIDGRSDQYSLGLVAYEMLAGRFPFSADSLAGIVYKHLHDYPESLEKLRPDIPLDLRQAIGCAIRKKRDERFASMRDLLQAIGAPAPRNGEVQVAPSPVASARVRSRRPAWAAGLAAAATAIVVVGLLIGQRLTEPPAGEPQLAEIEVSPVTGGEAQMNGAGLVDSTRVAPDSGGAAAPATGPGTGGMPTLDVVAAEEEGQTRPAAEPPAEVDNREVERSRAEQAREAVDFSRQTAIDNRADSLFPERFAVIEGQQRSAEIALEAGDLVAAALGFSVARQEFEMLASDAQQRLNEAAATPEPEPPIEPASLPPEATIRSLIETYRTALEAEDLERLEVEVYRRPIPDEDADKINLWLGAAEELTIAIEFLQDLDVDGDRAEARLSQNMKFLLSSTHERRDVSVRLRLHFQQVDGLWRLERIEN
jgi:predicted Ser/Thr protein kinase